MSSSFNTIIELLNTFRGTNVHPDSVTVCTFNRSTDDEISIGYGRIDKNMYVRPQDGTVEETERCVKLKQFARELFEILPENENSLRILQKACLISVEWGTIIHNDGTLANSYEYYAAQDFNSHITGNFEYIDAVRNKARMIQ